MKKWRVNIHTRKAVATPQPKKTAGAQLHGVTASAINGVSFLLWKAIALLVELTYSGPSKQNISVAAYTTGTHRALAGCVLMVLKQ